jgi:hypothetical protein
MKKSTLFGCCLFAAFAFVSCESNDESNSGKDSFYKIISNGGGGVTTITDVADTTPLQIAQAIPSVSGRDYPSNIPIVFFFNDKLLVSSITEDSFIVTENGSQVSGTISVNEASNGYAIFTFTPNHGFSGNADIQITLTTAIQDDGGQGLEQEVVYQYTTFDEPTDDFAGNEGFENGNDGIVFIGDGNVLTGSQGCMDPFEGSSFGGITTGDHLISSGDAIGGASSLMILGPYDSDVSSVSFNYNFLSSEFQEYVGSEFDDSFVAVVIGENGAYSELITSVNILGLANTQCFGFPGLPDNGDDYAGTTGWVNKEISFGSLTGPVYIVFIATDVADQIYSTAVGIDNVAFN